MRISTSAMVTVALLATASSAQAGKFVATDFAEGLENQAIVKHGVTIGLNSDPRGIAYEDGGAGGLGVYGGGADSEVGSVDKLTFFFSDPVNMHRLEIGKLFAEGVNGDIIDENIRITTDNGSWVVTAADVVAGTVFANQDFGGNLVSVDGAGTWRLGGTSLFGGPITFMSLEPETEGLFPYYADFTFLSGSFTPVPAPGTAALAGVGCLMCARRRRAA
ncbi:MAG: hypothetical protein DHS20C14_22800 [Phycisphaeraceae bacterium]|nr:MAG: hypothetical protein DHS20C14_22800 [Phycisphaeraceae bacterium]